MKSRNGTFNDSLLTRASRVIAVAALALALVCIALPSRAGLLKAQQGPELRGGQEDPSFGVPDQPEGGGSAPRGIKPRGPRAASANKSRPIRAGAVLKARILETLDLRLYVR